MTTARMTTTLHSGLPVKRQAIMRAATAVFIRDGYERASVDTIAAEAGVSKQTIYNHFKDKQALFVAVVDAARAEADAGPPIDERLLSDPERLEPDLIALGRLFLTSALDPHVSALRRLIIAEVGRHPQLDQACGDGDRPTGPAVVRWLSHRIEVLSARGALDAPDPRKAARQFVSLLLHEGQQRSGYGTAELSERDLAEICGDATDLFLRAFRPHRD